MKTKNGFNVIILLFTFLLYACGNASTTTELPPTPLTITTFTPLPTLAFISTMPDGITPTYPPYHSPTPTDTSTPTSTPDYAALGIPSPTPTPTFEYNKLSSFYLTPFTPWPTQTGISSLTPTANIPNMLSNVVIRKVPPNPPLARKVYDDFHSQDYGEWISSFSQSATDLMNYADGDKKTYLQYIEGRVPKALTYSPNDWFLENDYDNDGESEWLVSFPTQNPNDGLFHCGDMVHTYCARYFFLFEKTGNAYYPIKTMSTAEEKIALVKDLNNNHMLDIVFQADPCGTACSTYLHIMEWDGNDWKDY